MKRVTAIVRPEKMEPLKEALFEAHVSGMTISQVHGCGNQHGWKEYFRGTEVLLNMVPNNIVSAKPILMARKTSKSHDGIDIINISIAAIIYKATPKSAFFTFILPFLSLIIT